MKVAHLIDCESIGGGCEYIRRKSDERRARKDDCRTFYSDKGECRAKALDAWGADEIVVNHLKALLQLLGRPWERPQGKVRMVVHGIHLRKYAWRARELGVSDTIKQVRPVLWCGRAALWLCFQVRRTLESWLYHRCDEIVVLTETDRADVVRLYGRDLRVVVEPNALEGWTPHLADASEMWMRLSQSRPGAAATRLTRLGQTHHPRYVCIGRFDYQKGQDRWIRYLAAHSISRDSRPVIPELSSSSPVPLTFFIGDGETLESCQRLAADLGVADRCVFAGAISDADRYLKCADVVVSPSRWEGMPYLLMKARALGCRILATDCPGNRDVLAGYDKWERLVFTPDMV